MIVNQKQDDIQDDTNIPVTEEEEVGEDNLQEAQIEENELKEFVKQKIVEDINVKTTSKILPSLHKGVLIGSKKVISACKLAKRELQPFLNYILPKQYIYDNSRIRTHQYSNEEKPSECVSFVVVQPTGSRSCFFNSASILKVGYESASEVLRALTAAELGRFTPGGVGSIL